MSDEILTVDEVAALLKVGDKTVYTMAQRGEIPAFKVREQWRFRRADIDEWISHQTAGKLMPVSKAKPRGKGKR